MKDGSNGNPQDFSKILAETARRLSETELIRTHPADAQALLQDLCSATDSLMQIATQLSRGHSRAIRRGDYIPTKDSATAADDAAAQLLAAARFLSAARDSLRSAEETDSEVRWTRRPPPDSADLET